MSDDHDHDIKHFNKINTLILSIILIIKKKIF